MKQASIRLLVYFAISVIIDAIFQTFPTSHTAPWIVGHYLGAMAPLAVVGETATIIRNIRHNRRIENQPTKPFDVPETNKLTKP